MNLEQLSRCCESFNSEESSDFSNIIKNSLKLINDFRKDLEKQFDVNDETISRWENGSAKPLPRFQQLIVNFILEKIK